MHYKSEVYNSSVLVRSVVIECLKMPFEEKKCLVRKIAS